MVSDANYEGISDAEILNVTPFIDARARVEARKEPRGARKGIAAEGEETGSNIPKERMHERSC